MDNYNNDNTWGSIFRALRSLVAVVVGLVVGAIVGIFGSFAVCYPMAMAMDDGHGGAGAVAMLWGMVIAPISAIVFAIIGAALLTYKASRWTR
jgi:uncharacterized membrane protein